MEKKKKKKTWLIIVLVVVAVIAFLIIRTVGKVKTAMADVMGSVYSFDTVQRRDVSRTLTGSGTLQPEESYTVISLVSGEILHADFSTGDVVAKDDILYEVDSSDISNSLERADIALSQARRAYNKRIESQSDLTVKAPIGGTVSGITVSPGDNANTYGLAAIIENTDKLAITEYYSNQYAGLIQVGTQAQVSVEGRMVSLTGTVTEISSLTRMSETGIPCFGVTVEFDNPGALTPGEGAYCTLSCGDQTLYPSIGSEKGLEAAERTCVYYDISGTVISVYVNNGEKISKGQTIMVLSSDTLPDEIQSAADSLRDAELSLEKTTDMLDEYTIKAPIDGTIVDKYYKEGENAETGKILCTIFDQSDLKVVLNVDELDIMDVAVGQKATVTADAVPGVTYEAEITEMSINGSTMGGVTTYPVTVTIAQAEGLLPGMNVDVKIVTGQASNVLTIPADAVSDKDMVLVKTVDGTTGQGAPEGYDYVKVETGIFDEDFVEILSGLDENAEIAYIPASAADSNLFYNLGRAMGGGMGGDVEVTMGPSGGMGGF